MLVGSCRLGLPKSHILLRYIAASLLTTSSIQFCVDQLRSRAPSLPFPVVCSACSRISSKRYAEELGLRLQALLTPHVSYNMDSTDFRPGRCQGCHHDLPRSQVRRLCARSHLLEASSSKRPVNRNRRPGLLPRPALQDPKDRL